MLNTRGSWGFGRKGSVEDKNSLKFNIHGVGIFSETSKIITLCCNCYWLDSSCSLGFFLYRLSSLYWLNLWDTGGISSPSDSTSLQSSSDTEKYTSSWSKEKKTF